MTPALLTRTLSLGCASSRRRAKSVHVRPSGDRAVERVPAPSGDDHRVALIMESVGERLADPRSAARDENRVAGHFHEKNPWIRSLPSRELGDVRK